MKVQPVSPAMGVRISGIDVRGADTTMVGELRSLLLDHQLLVIAGQHLPHLELQEFGCKWGELLTHPSGMDAKSPYVQVLSSRKGVRGKAFGAWHSDMSWHPTPPWITMLHAHTIPPWGGDTGYANQHLAWESLDRAAKDTRRMFRRGLCSAEQLVGLRAFHTGKGFGPEVPDSIHPVVRIHDETHRPALYVNPEFTSHITNMPETDSALMLFPLWAHAITQEFTYRHTWSTGDLLIWDNRSVMHTAILDYDAPRKMARVIVKGDKPLSSS
ncbi:MAG: TauD/TfdA family dioxygenase [Gammaproteobacteria bacterium]|nr:TauD/TfdA family dioxygenase [Pseudomonadota bacterium]TDJ36610.1 MAG: TauD/TfdA family dioxygenase [Gammaproteobacteria bacterium]